MLRWRSCAAARASDRKRARLDSSAEIARMDHFERDFATQVCVERFVGDAHGTAAELDWLAIIAIDELILVEPMWSAA